MVMCFAICLDLAQIFRGLLMVENRRRDRKYGLSTEEYGLQDLTDGENKSFRYPL